MAQAARSKSLIIPAILAFIVLALIGYVLFTDFEPNRTEHTVTPPIEIVEPEIEDVVIEIDRSATDAEQQQILQEEAETFVDNLATSPDSDDTVTLTEDIGQFVRHDGKILLPKLEHRQTTVEALVQDSELPADTPITLHYTETETRETTLEQLDTVTEDKTQLVTIETAQGEITTAPLADLLNQPIDKEAKIKVITQHQLSKQTTAGELAQVELEADQPVIATIDHGVEEIAVKEIIQANDMPDDALFYLHRVTEADVQGLWGIVQGGLVQRFRKGLKLHGIGINKELLQVTIPHDADEPLPSGLSSFLGKVLNQKVESSYIYNVSTHSMGRNPDLILPGQQLILIHFTQDELTQIYLFFAEQRSSDAKSFAIIQ